MNRWNDMLAEVFPVQQTREEFLRDPSGWWRTTERADLMLGIVVRLSDRGDLMHRATVVSACACARLALPAWEVRYPGDDRPRRAIVTAEQWSRGEATDEEVVAAQRSATTAAWESSRQGTRQTAVAASFAAAQALADAGGPAQYIPVGAVTLAAMAEIVRANIPAELFADAVNRWRSEV